ncbi:RtcB family protein [Photorhabdus viridis]|uniref:RtcB family protein n=1 Tax=Photorhabdus viridis TaxID=3163327 RepID=UPI003306D1FB
MRTNDYELMTAPNSAPVKMWTHGVPVEADAREQRLNTAKMPFIFSKLHAIRHAIEIAVPHGRIVNHTGHDKGSWQKPPETTDHHGSILQAGFKRLTDKYPELLKTNNHQHLGTLSTGNHFIELCLDESDRIWVMLHNGSRGVGNAIGSLLTCRKDSDVIDEIPMTYKDIEAVMVAQSSLVEIVPPLRQVVCVKG